MLSIIHLPSVLARGLQVNKPSWKLNSLVVCCTRDQKPRFSQTWKTQKRIGIISNSQKLINSIKELSNVKEEVYGVLDSYIAWELEFPLIVIKKALKTLELQKEWKRVIQVIKWMLNKGQGQSLGTYFTLLNALIEDDRLEEAEKLYTMMFSKYLESLPRSFFAKMIFLYYCKGLNEKMFEIFADMDELRVRPNRSIVRMVGKVFKRLGMADKYEKLNKKYPPAKWEYRLVKRGKYVKLPTKPWSANDDAAATIEIQELQFNHTDKTDVAPRAILPPASEFGCEAETELVLEQLSAFSLVIDETYA